MMNEVMFVFENCDHCRSTRWSIFTVNGGFVEIENLKFYTDGGISSVVLLVKNLDKNSRGRFFEGDLTQINFGVLDKTLYISKEDNLVIETFGDSGIKLDIKII